MTSKRQKAKVVMQVRRHYRSRRYQIICLIFYSVFGLAVVGAAIAVFNGKAANVQDAASPELVQDTASNVNSPPYREINRTKKIDEDFPDAYPYQEIKPLPKTDYTSPFGQFPARTPAEKELEDMLRGPDEDIDLALANFLIAVDIPQFKDLRRSEYFDLLNTSIQNVKSEITLARMNPQLAGPLNKPENLAHAFAGGIVKQDFAYVEEFRNPFLSTKETAALYRNADNIFLAGLLRSGRGSCVSMPLLYTVIAERLNFPVYMVCVGKHIFCAVGAAGVPDEL